MVELPNNVDLRSVGVIVVDHGSRRAESNDMLLDVVKMFERLGDWSIVEPAHMELAEPTIGQAFDRCVARGAKRVICFPYFLGPGRHWDQDIPRLTTAAAAKHPKIKWLITAPLGSHELMAKIMNERILHCLACAAGKAEPCDISAQCDGCAFRDSS